MTKSGKRGYLNDFKADANGQYIYNGEYLSFAGDREELKLLKKSLMLLGIIICSFAVIGGFLRGQGITNSAFVILPYVIELASSFGCLVSCIKLMRSEQPMRRYVYDRSVHVLKPRTMCCLIASATGLVADIIVVALLGFNEHILETVIYMILKILSIVACVMVTKLTAKLIFMPDKDLKKEP